MGDIESAGDYINYMCKAGYEGVVGFNLDGSHMEWQNVSVDRSSSASSRSSSTAPTSRACGWPASTAGPGGSAGTGRWATGRTAGTSSPPAPPATPTALEEIFIELNRVGFDGAVSIEWEDNDAEQHAGAKTALANCRKADIPAERHAARRDAEGLINRPHEGHRRERSVAFSHFLSQGCHLKCNGENNILDSPDPFR